MQDSKNKNYLCWGLTIFLAIVAVAILVYQNNVLMSPGLGSGAVRQGDINQIVSSVEILEKKMEMDKIEREGQLELLQEIQRVELEVLGEKMMAFQDTQTILTMLGEGEISKCLKEELARCFSDVFLPCLKEALDNYISRLEVIQEKLFLCIDAAFETFFADREACLAEHNLKNYQACEEIPACKECLEKAEQDLKKAKEECYADADREKEIARQKYEEEKALCSEKRKKCVDEAMKKCGVVISN